MKADAAQLAGAKKSAKLYVDGEAARAESSALRN